MKHLLNAIMLLMIAISIIWSTLTVINVSVAASTSGTSSLTVTKIVQEAVTSSLPTKQSNSILQQSTSTNNLQSVKQDSLYEQTTSKSQLKASPHTDVRNMLTGNIGSVIWTLDPNVGNLHFSGGTFPDKLPNDIPWRLRGWEHLGDIKSVTFDGEIQAKDVTGLFDGGGVGIPNLTTVEGMPNLKGVTHYDNFFSRDKNLTSIDATAIDFSETLTVNSMFFNCDKLRSVGDTTNWNISKITSLGGWFMGCTNLSDLNTTNWNTSQVTNMNNTFFGCSALQKLDVANWDVSKVTTLSQTFATSGIVSLNVKNWDTKQVTNLNATFSNDKNLTTLDVSNWDIGNVTDLNSTFTQDSKLTALNVSNWDTKNVTTMNSTFTNCSSLKQLDVSQWDISNVTSLNSTFSVCEGVTQLDVSNWKTDNVTNMYSLFANTGIIELNMANWNTAKVTDMRYMFSRMTSLARAYFTNWDTSQVTDMNSMFNGDKALSHVRLGPKFKFLVTDTSRPALPKPSTEIPYYGKWQRHDVTNNPVGDTYTSEELMAQYDGIKLPIGDYYWAISTPPTPIKEVKNITKADQDYALETAVEVDDEIEYRIQIVNTASDDIKPGAILKDVFDVDLGDIQQVKIDYLDQDEKITATQTTDWANNQVTLNHGIPIAGQGMAIAYVKAKVKETNKAVINNSASLATDFGTGTSEKAKLNIKQSKGRIVVRYRDRKDENHKLAEDKIYDGKIGDTQKIQPKVVPDSQGNWTVVDSSDQTNPDWSSTTKPDWSLAHDYTITYAKDEQVITYRYEESHIGIIADKRWDFGKYDTTGTDRNYYLKAKTKDNQKQPYAVGVEDYYTSKGWTLNVKQDDQFHTNANEKIAGDQKFLDNAVLNFHNGQVALKESDDVGATAPVSKVTSEFELTPKGAAVNLMTHTNKTPDPGYYAAHGFGIWEYQFGDSKQADYSIGLQVPKTTKRYPRQYTSQLTWSLVIAE